MEVLDEKLEYEYNNDLDTDLEIIEEKSPVYIRKDSIPDVLAVRNLDDAIVAKETEKTAKENEVSEVQAKRKELSDKIGIINNGQHINQVAAKLANLRKLDEEIVVKESELEEIYADLRKLQEDRDALDETARNMVDKMTDEYNEIVEKQIRLVEKYRSTADYTVYKDALDLTDDANEFAAYYNYKAILDGNEIKPEEEKVEETKEEVAEQKVEETEEKEVEAPEAEKAVVTELSEVKVDSLPEAEVAENKEEKDEEVAPSEPVKAEVTPIVEEKVAMPTFEELMEKAKEAEAQSVEKAEVTSIAEQKVEETKPEVTAEVPETPVAEVTPLATPEVKQEQELKIAILTSKNDKIAETDGAKVTGIKEVFANSKTVEEAKTLELSA